MKKLFILLALFLTVSTCHAKISENRIAVGGVYPGMPFSEVVKMYGQPSSASADPMFNYSDYRFLDSDDTKCFSITTDKNNIVLSANQRYWCQRELATPDGIKKGSSEEEIIRVYGRPDARLTGKGMSLWYFQSEPEGKLDPKVLVFEFLYGGGVSQISAERHKYFSN